MAYYTSASADIRVSLNGRQINVNWITFSGGNLTKNNMKIRPAGFEIDLPGPGTRDDITVGCYATDASLGQLRDFEKGSVMSVAVTSKDENGNPSGLTTTYSGNVKGVNRPDLDTSSSDPEPVNFEVVMGCNEQVAYS